MSDFILQIEKLASAIGDAEYRYLLLEPMILFGILAGVIMMIVSLFIRAPKLQIAALVTIGVAALIHSPYQEARRTAQPRIEQVYKISSPARVKGFKENSNAWTAKSWQFKLLILVAVLTFLVGVNRNKFGYWLAVSSIVLGLIAAKNVMWLNYQDAIAYHPNLKTHEAPMDKKVVSAPPSKTATSNYAPTPKPQPKVKRIEPKPIVKVPAPQQAARTPQPPAVQALTPSGLTRALSAPAPPRSSYPQPSGYNTSRIPAPDMPRNKPAPAPAPRARAVQPLPRY